MSEDDRIVQLAQRALVAPETLTPDEIREICAAVLCDLYDEGDGVKPESPSQN